MKLKTLPRRLLAALMTLLLAVGLTIPLSPSASAASEMDIYLVQLPSSSGSSKWGHGDLYFMNGWTAKSTTRFIAKGMGTRGGQIAYCIETGINLSSGNSLHYCGEDFWDEFPSSLNSTIPPALIRAYIGRIMQYGYTGECSSDWDVNSSHDRDMMANMMATQYLIWETVVGERDAGFNLVTPPDGCDAVHDMLNPNHPFYDEIQAYYDSIEASVKTHSIVPSFMTRSTGNAPTYELKWDGSGYSATLTDANGVLGNYQFSSDTAGVTFEVSGNDLIIRSDTAPKEPISVTADKLNSMRRGVITWTDGVFSNENNGQRQDVVTYGEEVSDPVSGYMALEVSAGSLKIVKTSEDGVVAGITFTITGNGVNQTVTTGSDGTIQVDNLAPGTYTVTEQPIDRYETPSAQQVTVVSGQTAEIHFANKLRRGSLEVTKTSEDGLAEGIKFHLYGSSLSGAAVDEYAVTDSTGVAKFENILIGFGYILEEVDTAERYVVPDSQTVRINWNEVTNRSFENVLKKWQATVTKSDAETGSPQGGASLAGAVYGVYQGDELVDTYTTDANGRFTTAYYPCGDDWSIREISPSEGYLLDETSYHVGAEAALYTIECNSTELSVSEQVIKGKIAIIKHTDDGETGIDTPEAGAEFQVYHKNAGSYDSAPDSERDVLVCDEYGYAVTKELPYGIYTVHQVSGWDGREMMPDFDVYIARDGQTYRYLINNSNFESYIKLIKIDSETGKAIPYAGAGFQIYDPSGNLVTMTYTYPEITTIDTFYTNSEGFLITPESLEYGTGYSLVEVAAPYGYVLNSTPIYFDVTQDLSTAESDITVIEMTVPNTPQKGTITVTKHGEVFSYVTATGGGYVDEDGNDVTFPTIYQPVYTVAGLEGAVYEVTAAEDIYTPDGTLRSAAGEVVDTITTGADGTAATTKLYLGKYELREITAPYGMVLNEEVHTVELTYAGQEISITETASSFYNERQRVQIDLVKALEQDDMFQIGMNSEITAVTFGLYAAEELTASDGSVIPADGLLEIVAMDESGHAAVKTDLPFGSYYLKELSTDSHYMLSDAKYPVVFAYAGQETAVVEIKANDGSAIENDLIRGSVSGRKVGESGEGLAGAVIGLFRPEETEFTVDTALIVTTSGEDGAFRFEQMPFGQWTLRELSAPAGHVLSGMSVSVVISADQESVSLTLENRMICGGISLTKVDAEYPDHLLTGAVFEVSADTNRNGKLDEEDSSVGTLYESEPGNYTLTNLIYGRYFVRETRAPVGFKLDPGVYTVEIAEDGVTYVVENEAGVGFINQPTTGTLEITKRDLSTGALLPNAGFRILDAQGNVVLEGYTDENGFASFSLRTGSYSYQEFDAPEGYLIDDTAYPFTLTEDGQIIAVTMTNRKPEQVQGPKTGDGSHPGIWIGLGATALGGLAAMGIIKCKRKKENE